MTLSSDESISKEEEKYDKKSEEKSLKKNSNEGLTHIDTLLKLINFKRRKKGKTRSGKSQTNATNVTLYPLRQVA